MEDTWFPDFFPSLLSPRIYSSHISNKQSTDLSMNKSSKSVRVISIVDRLEKWKKIAFNDMLDIQKVIILNLFKLKC